METGELAIGAFGPSNYEKDRINWVYKLNDEELKREIENLEEFIRSVERSTNSRVTSKAKFKGDN